MVLGLALLAAFLATGPNNIFLHEAINALGKRDFGTVLVNRALIKECKIQKHIHGPINIPGTFLKCLFNGQRRDCGEQIVQIVHLVLLSCPRQGSRPISSNCVCEVGFGVRFGLCGSATLIGRIFQRE